MKKRLLAIEVQISLKYLILPCKHTALLTLLNVEKYQKNSALEHEAVTQGTEIYYTCVAEHFTFSLRGIPL